MKRYANPPTSEWAALAQRPTLDYSVHHDLVKSVFDAVESDGDQALIQFARQFDLAELNTLRLENTSIESAEAELSEPLKQAIQQAAANIRLFHRAQQTDEVFVETQPGVKCW
ncbi:MAG: histidinol dehydrogenase, partial [Flavobacteriaceae bacterium]